MGKNLQIDLFRQIKQQLSQKQPTNYANSDLIRIEVELSAEIHNLSLLAWLKAQPLFPHFFWQQRDGQQTLVAAGAVCEFHSLAEAQSFALAHQAQLVGGLQFDSRAHFVLPRLLLTFAKNSSKLTACINLKEQELDDLVQYSHYFDQFSPLQPQENALRSRQVACDFERWQHNIHCAIQLIQQQHFNKVVLANATQLEFEQAVCPYALLAKSMAQHTACYPFLWAENADTAFVGATPERLYAREGNQLYTEALAGTVAVTQNEAENQQNADWLLHDLKNSYENWLVVEDIQENLLNLVREMDVSSLQIKRLSLVQHLYRNIQAVLENHTQDNHCLAQLHPTAAVAGIPYEPAFAFIQQAEPFERGWYAGTLGYFNPECAEFCVTIRSAQIQRNCVTVYAGAGIVEGSEPETEWREIERKAQGMLRLFER